MPHLQFSLRDVFLATTLIAFGVGGIVLMAHGASFRSLDLPIWCGSFALIGAGMLSPFHAKATGAYLGIVTAIGIFMISRIM